MKQRQIARQQYRGGFPTTTVVVDTLMMVFTHILIGIAIGAYTATATGVEPMALVVAGGVGGLLPDLDMVAIHRKTGHFPVVYSILAPLIAIGYVLTGHSELLVVAVGVAGGSVHSVMDMLGGGKEMRPWREIDDRAVYDHVRGHWISPLRVFYDGSVPDVILAVAAGLLSVVVAPPQYTAPIGLLMGLALVYALGRRAVTRWIPDRYTTFSRFIQVKLQLKQEPREEDDGRY